MSEHLNYLDKPYNITLNSELIVATLTYYSPEDLMTEEELESLSYLYAEDELIILGWMWL